MNIILIGEKGSGKSTVEKMLKERDNFKKIVSYTTRRPRKSEVDGIDYNFVSRKEFKELERNGKFAESVENFGNLYGIAKDDLLNSENNVIVVEAKGLKQIIDNVGRDNIFVIKFQCELFERIARIMRRDEPIHLKQVEKTLDTILEDDEIMRNVNWNNLVDYTVDTTNKDKESIYFDIKGAISYAYRRENEQRDG